MTIWLGQFGTEIGQATMLGGYGDSGHLREINLDGSVELKLVEQSLCGGGGRVAILEFEVAIGGLDRPSVPIQP